MRFALCKLLTVTPLRLTPYNILVMPYLSSEAETSPILRSPAERDEGWMPSLLCFSCIQRIEPANTNYGRSRAI